MAPTVPPPPNAADNDDRRTEPRAPIELKVEYKRLNSFFADYTRNISKGGTFITTSKPLPIGTEFVFKLGIPGMPEPLQLLGKVAWLVTPEGASPMQPAGMGIRFQYRDDVERATVHGAVEKLMRESLGEFLSGKLLSETGAGDAEKKSGE